MNASAHEGSVAGQLLVRYKRGTDQTVKAETEEALGARVVRKIPRLGVRILAVQPGSEIATLRALKRNARVSSVEVDAYVAATATPNDPWWPNEWGPVKVRAPQAWDLTTGASSVVVAVLDTGVDATQPDLQGKLVSGRDIVNNDADPADDHGHGTYVAGVVGAATDNATGVASYCWTCAIMPVKVLGADGSGTMSDVASGIVWATDHGARVINMSLGGSTSSSTLASAVTYAHDRGVVIVASAGNYATTAKVYPAAYPDVIGVAGTDGTDTLYSWSTYGSWVAVSAPGCNFTTGRNAWYGTFCGTSSASPVVAGLAGLAAAYAPSASNTDIERALESTAVKIGNVVAYGRVDARAALDALGGTSAPSPSPTPTPTPTASPAPTPTASPTPTPTPTAAPSSTPSPSPTSTMSSATYRGTLTSKNRQKSYAFSAGSGTLVASLDFSGSPSLTVTLLDSSGQVLATASGASILGLSTAVPAGTKEIVVSGDGTKASFRLAVTYPTS